MENQSIGDQIDDKLDEFLNKHQDTNPFNGNNTISGLKPKSNENSASSNQATDEHDEYYEQMIEKKNISQI